MWTQIHMKTHKHMKTDFSYSHTVKEHPQVQKLRMTARRMIMRMVIEKIQHPPRRRNTK